MKKTFFVLLVCPAVVGGSTGGAYELRSDLTRRRLMPVGSGFFGGLSLIRPGALVISSQPVAVVTTPGATATFFVGAAAGGFTYQWRLNGRNIPGATEAILIIPHADFIDAGMYSVLVISAGGAALSSEAALSVFDLSINPVVTLAGPVGARYRIDYRLGMEPNGAWMPLTNAPPRPTRTSSWTRPHHCRLNDFIVPSCCSDPVFPRPEEQNRKPT